MIAVRAFLFDTIGTLLDWRGGLITQLQTWGADRDIAADWPALVDAWRLDFVLSIAKVRSGEREWANQDQLQRESMARLAPLSIRSPWRAQGPDIGAMRPILTSVCAAAGDSVARVRAATAMIFW